jgi:hypothetical protein
MTKEALKLALEALEVANSCVDGYYIPKGKAHLPEIELAIIAIKEALANEALEKMAENARELGLDYEPEQTEHGWTPERIAGMARLKEAQDKKMAQQEQPKVRTGNCLRVGVCASEGHKIAPQRTWVGLDVEDYIKALELCDFDKDAAFEFFETKLKDLNNG